MSVGLKLRKYYHLKVRKVLPANWDELRSTCFVRDKHRCMRCDKRLTVLELTAHHIIPRSQGGPDTLNNLITLCGECHDIVECKEITTRAGIIGDDETVVNARRSEPDLTDWHTWVYGGCRNPNK